MLLLNKQDERYIKHVSIFSLASRWIFLNMFFVFPCKIDFSLYSRQTVCVYVCLCVCVGRGGGGGVDGVHIVFSCPSAQLWFLLLTLLNNVRNLLIFSKMLILIRCYCYTTIRAQGLIYLEVFPFVILEKAFWFLLILQNNFRNLFIFCINIDIDELLL